MAQGETVPNLIRHLLVLIKYEEHLKKSQQDWEMRWENVQELINFASHSENYILAQSIELHGCDHPPTESQLPPHQDQEQINPINVENDDEVKEPDLSYSTYAVPIHSVRTPSNPWLFSVKRP